MLYYIKKRVKMEWSRIKTQIQEEFGKSLDHLPVQTDYIALQNISEPFFRTVSW